MHVVIETSKKQMKYLFSDCRQSPWQTPRALSFLVQYGAWKLEQSRQIWRSCSKRKSGHMSGVGAKPLDMEKMLQEEKSAYIWSWSKAGRFGEVAPRGKVGICLELEQSRWIWRRCSKPERLLRAGIGVRQAGKKNCSNFGN